MRRKTNWRRAGVALGVALLALPWSAAGQEPAEEEDPLSNVTELALVQTTGNSETFTFSLKNQLIRRWERSSFTFDLLALRAETTTRILTNEDGGVIESSETEVTGDQYIVAFQYDRKISDRVGWLTLGRWERNRPAGIDARSNLDAGLSYLFLDNDVHRLVGEGGLGYTNEDPVDGDRDNFFHARAFSRYERALGETSSFDTQIELIQNLDNSDDLRINFLIGATAKLVGKLALRVSYTVNFDNDPVTVVVPGDEEGEPDGIFIFDDTDTILSASLVIDL